MADHAIDEAIAFLDSIVLTLKTDKHSSSSSPSHLDSTSPPQKAGVNLPIRKTAEKEDTSEKSVKEKIPGKIVSSNGESGDADDFDKAHLQVGLVQSVEDHPVAEKLYVCQVQLANKEVRQVVAGLRKFFAPSDLLQRKVCVILNLKPAKLAGQKSEAMILAGAVPTAGGGEIVKILEPPAESSIGERVFLEGGVPSLASAKQLSSKVWEKILPFLKVQGGVAMFGHRALVTSVGKVQVEDLPDGAGIH